MPTTPKSTHFIPLPQRSSDPRPLPVISKPARQGVINADKLPISNDFKGIKKRKRGESPGNEDCLIMNVDAQSAYHTPMKDIKSIPSTPRVLGKFAQHQAANGLLTPSSLGHSSPWKDYASPPVDVDHWYSNMSQSSGKPSVYLEIATPKDIEEIFSDCTGSPILELVQNPDLSINTSLSDRVRVPAQSSPLPNFSQIGLPYDVRPSDVDNSLEKVRRETKKPKLDQGFLPLMEPSNQCISRHHSSASIDGRAGLQNPISAVRRASETSPQTGGIQFGVSKGTSQSSPILIDLTESEEDDRQIRVGKTFRSLNNPIPKQMPELADGFDADFVWVKPGCEKAIANFKQDSSFTQNEAHIGGFTAHQNFFSGSTPASNGVLAEGSSMAYALQNYMRLRKEDNSKTERTISHYFPVIKPLVVDDRKKDDKSETSQPVKNVESHTAIPSMPKPQYVIPAGHRYFVVSTSVLRNRKLARRIQRLYPGAEFIERDFTLHGPSLNLLQRYPGPASLSTDNNYDEADITISPGIGIMLTTLQKIRQCSLPGQAVRFIVRERVTRVAPRYERLLILVSKDNMIDYSTNENSDVAPREIDSDYKTASDFMGFCASLKYDIQAMFIAGKEEQLTEWIVAMMAKHSGVDFGIKLISEETKWELFLRTAGFNSFAAQAILGECTGQITAAGGSTAATSRLSDFLKMSVEKRVERFEKMFGGSELLKRVSSQLEARK